MPNEEEHTLEHVVREASHGQQRDVGADFRRRTRLFVGVILFIIMVCILSVNPLRKLREGRDSARWVDVTALVNAVQIDQVEHRGAYLEPIGAIENGVPHMIIQGDEASGCAMHTCDSFILADAACVNLEGLVRGGYFASLPISPGDGWSKEATGYYLIKNMAGTITIGACESEVGDEIVITK